jgi:hypothetical protein
MASVDESSVKRDKALKRISSLLSLKKKSKKQTEKEIEQVSTFLHI